MDVFTMKMLGDAWTRTRNAWRTTRVLHPAGLILLIAMLDAAETPQPGLIGEYFAPDRQLSDFPEVAADELPVLVRVDAQINFKSRGGQFYGSALYDHFHVRWTGQLRIEEAGAYTFFLNSDDGSRLLIDGELVADNGGLHNMDDDASGRVELAAGLHELRLDYFEATGGAGCELRWQPPGGEKGLVPAEVLVHSADHTAIRSDAERLAALKKEARALGEGDPNAWYNRMQHGPVIVNSIEIRDWPQENWALKGLAIRLQSGLGRAGVVFDTELLRWAAVTDYGNIELTGIAYDGSHGPSPASAGELVAGTSQAPGIADDGDFADQRPIPFGPMAHARFGGYWLHDQQVVVDYRIGETTVLERPQVVAVGEEAHAFVRSLQVGASTQDLDLLIAESPDGSATAEGLDGSLPLAVRTVGGGELRAAGRRLVLHIPATATPTRIDVILAVTAATLDGLGERELDDLEALTHGGPARWRETVTTSGQLGTEDAAYAVDTITLPESNPYHAKLRLGAFDLFADGRRAAVSTWTGDVWVVDGIDEDLDQLTWRRFATGLFHPLGLRIVDDRIFVLVRDGITELQDLDGDGEADRYRNHNNEVYITKNFHEFAFDLQTDSEGNFYFSKAGPVPPGGRGFDQIVPTMAACFRSPLTAPSCRWSPPACARPTASASSMTRPGPRATTRAAGRRSAA